MAAYDKKKNKKLKTILMTLKMLWTSLLFVRSVVGWGQLKRIKGAFQMSRLISAPYLALKRSYSGFSLIKFCNEQTDGRMNSPKLCDPDHLKILPKVVP